MGVKVRRYPLRWYHLAVREFCCWVAGHRWSSSWRHREDYAERVAQDQRDLLPYRDRRDNPYFEWSAGWHYKCRRCRLQTRDDRWEPWYRDLWWGIRSGTQHAWWGVEFYVLDRWRHGQETYYVLPHRYWPIVGLVAVADAVGYALLPWWMDRDWPIQWLGGLVLDAADTLHRYLNDRFITMRWVPPRTSGELGYWMLQELHDPENPMRVTMEVVGQVEL